MRPFIAVLLLVLLSGTAQANERTTLSGNMTQGGLVFGQTEPGASLMLGMRPVPVGANGAFAFGLGRDSPQETMLYIRYPDGSEEERVLSIAGRQYRIQRIDRVPPRYVEPPADVVERILREIEMVREARARFTDATMYRNRFDWPVTGRISGVYGSQRIYNGVPRRPHFGVDVAVPRGTPVYAPATGQVTLTHHLYFSGKTVILDHGHGVFSTYIHLDEIAVTAGQRVEAGDLLGRVGTTGRSTGPHLHWGLNWFDVRLDPALVAGPMPQARR